MKQVIHVMKTHRDLKSLTIKITREEHLTTCKVRMINLCFQRFITTNASVITEQAKASPPLVLFCQPATFPMGKVPLYQLATTTGSYRIRATPFKIVLDSVLFSVTRFRITSLISRLRAQTGTIRR